MEQVRGLPFLAGLVFAFESALSVCLVTEYCSGGELFYLLKRVRRMKEWEARFYFSEMVLAIDCLHGLGVVYRDLKPENILVDRDGHCRLTDFGLSKSIPEG
jgi:serum/glucocorticoid-regulated kinase 2